MVQVASSPLGMGSKDSWDTTWSGAPRAQGALGPAGDTSYRMKNNGKVLWGKRFVLKMDNAATGQGAKAGGAIGT